MDKAQPSELVESLIVSLAHLFDGTGCPAIVVTEATDEGVSLSLHFSTERAKNLIERLTPTPGPSCSTCGATNPDENQYCSNGFHAKGPTYWPTPEPCRVREALVEAREVTFRAAHCVEDELAWLAQATLPKIDSALSASPAEPEEATEAMIEAIKRAAFDCTEPISRKTAAAIYRAMRSAALGETK